MGDVVRLEPGDAERRAWLPPGTLCLGRYRIEEPLGQGTTKTVYRARDEHLDRHVALGVIDLRGLDPTAVTRFREEARSIARLGEHPHIVGVYDTQEERKRLFIVGQYVEGGTLSERLAQTGDRPLELAETVRIARELCEAMEHIHSHGVVHRDLKPANVWFTRDGRVKLGDFGLAAAVEGSAVSVSSSTPSSDKPAHAGHAITGTVLYMPPEQATGGVVSERSDLYSLGCLLYELATGAPPFSGEDSAEILSRHVHEEPGSPRARNPEVPPPLERLILRLLSKKPDGRPDSAEAVRTTLEEIGKSLVSGDSGQAGAGDTSPSSSPSPGETFVGRAEEMRQLTRALAEALSGQGRLVFLSGDAGIGKTRLTEELSRQAESEGATVLLGRCHEGEGAPAFWPWVQIIRDYTHRTDPRALSEQMGPGGSDIAEIVPEVKEKLPDLPPSPKIEGEAARFRLFDSITRFLKSAAAANPLVLVLDDLHWADEPSLLLLRFAAREMAESRLLILGTHRPLEVERSEGLRKTLPQLRRERVYRPIAVRGLRETDVGRMLSALARKAVPDSLVRAISRETEGNPFFVEEVLRHLIEEGVLYEEERLATTFRPEDLRLPEGVREVIERRVARLPEECREVLGAASVIGREFDLATLGLTTGKEQSRLLETLDEAEQTKVIRSLPKRIGYYQFTHALIRETLYGELGAGRRTDLHGAVGRAIEELHGKNPEPHLTELAHHFVQAAAGGNPRKAIDYAVRAGTRALRLHAFEEGAGHFTQALQLLEQAGSAVDEERCELLLQLGESQRAAGATADARNTYVQAADLARETGFATHLARAQLGVGTTSFAISWWGDAVTDVDLVDRLEEARAALGDGDGALRVRVTARLARALHWEQDHSRRDRLSQEAVDVARRIGDPRELARALVSRYMARTGPDLDPGEWQRLHDEARELAAAAGDRELLLELAAHSAARLMESGDREAFQRAVDEFDAQARELRQAQHLWYAQVLRTTVAVLDGRFGEFDALANAALQFGRFSDDVATVHYYSAQVVQLRVLQGRIRELESAARGYVDRYPTLPIWRAGLTLALLNGDREEEARRELDTLASHGFSDFARNAYWLTGACASAIACTFLGDRERAGALYTLIRPFDGRYVALPPALASFAPVALHLSHLSIILRRFDQSVKHSEAALEQCRRLRDEPLAAITRTVLAYALIGRGRSGDRERAEELYREARERFEAIGVRDILLWPPTRRTLERIAREEGFLQSFYEVVLDEAAPEEAFVVREGFFSRMVGKVRRRALGVLARAVQGKSDEALERRFGTRLSQRILFRVMASSFQPHKAYGFEGDIVLELTHASEGADAPEPDLWTITVEGRGARARRCEVTDPAVRVRVSFPDFVRMFAGLVNPISALFEGRTEVEGDLAVASRLVEMFGGTMPEAAGLETSLEGEAAREGRAAAASDVDARSRQWVAHAQYEQAKRLLESDDEPDARERGLARLDECLAMARELGMKRLTEKALALKLEAQGASGTDVGGSIDAVAASVGHARPDVARATAPDGTVTLMFSDVEGSTEMVEELGDLEAFRLIEEHNQIVRAAVEAHGGFEIDSQGDGFFVVFTSTGAGLRCAVAIQEKLRQWNLEHEGFPLHVRIGLHVGEPVRSGDNFYGKTVIQAARIAASGRGREIVVSSLVHELGSSGGDFSFDVGREIELKGLSGTYRVHRLVWDPEAQAEIDAERAAAAETQTGAVEAGQIGAGAAGTGTAASGGSRAGTVTSGTTTSRPGETGAPRTGAATSASHGDTGVRTDTGEAEATPASLLTLEGDFWTVRGTDGVFRLKDSKGLRLLDHLLAHPGREFHAIDLASLGDSPSPSGAGVSGGGSGASSAAAAGLGMGTGPDGADVRADLGDAGEMLDAQARREYEARVKDLHSELEEAETNNDTGRATLLREELDQIATELARAVGLGGRNRKAAAASERARVSVTRALKSAITKIRDHDPALGRSLAASVKTGTFCSFQPDEEATKR